MTAVRLEVRIGAPAKALSPNARVHWAQRAAATERSRWEARWAAISAWCDAYDRGELPTLRPRVVRDLRIEAVFERRARPGRRPDKTNLSASLKPAIDGLVDAGLLEDDQEVQPPPVEIREGKDQVVLIITGTLD